MILRKGSSFEKCSSVRLVSLIMLVANSLFVKKLCRRIISELDVAILKAGTAKCDLSEIMFKYIHEPNTIENSTDKNGN
jgi:hypothetical protein